MKLWYDVPHILNLGLIISCHHHHHRHISQLKNYTLLFLIQIQLGEQQILMCQQPKTKGLSEQLGSHKCTVSMPVSQVILENANKDK